MDRQTPKTLLNSTENRLTDMGKHIMVKYDWIREQSTANEVNILKIATADNPADMFTKALGTNLFNSHLHRYLSSIWGDVEKSTIDFYNVRHITDKMKNWAKLVEGEKGAQ